MKRYGIYIAYAPSVSLRHDGLSRYLAQFLLAATHQSQCRFVLVCPSWSRAPLAELFREAGIAPDAVEVIGPEDEPLVLRIVRAFTQRRRKRRDGRSHGPLARLRVAARAAGSDALSFVVSIRKVALFALVLLTAALAAILVSPLAAIVVLALAALALVRRGIAKWRRWAWVGRPLSYLRELMPSWSHRILRAVYDRMQARELQLMREIAEAGAPIDAWYCPAAFWPTFTELQGAKLVCVPDFVVSLFPAPFARLTNERAAQAVRAIERTIRQSSHFVTYSDHTRQVALVDRFGIPAQSVEVVAHAPNDLSSLLRFEGVPDAEAAAAALARTLLLSKLSSATNTRYAVSFQNDQVAFIFYASQLRPSKNVITLLRAYEYLLRSRYLPHKLILTGDPTSDPEVADFVSDHNLERDVLFLPGMSERELAAFYSLADLAVNPSLSEGGMPFTFTEALSVGTPVVMGNIAVTREVMTDPALREASLFDPYDWRAMAEKIEWALEHKAELYSLQRRFYHEVLAKRTWDSVVAEHIAILDRISKPARR